MHNGSMWLDNPVPLSDGEKWRISEVNPIVFVPGGAAFLYTFLISSTEGLVWQFTYYHHLSREEGKKQKDAIKPSTPWFQETKSA